MHDMLFLVKVQLNLFLQTLYLAKICHLNFLYTSNSELCSCGSQFGAFNVLACNIWFVTKLMFLETTSNFRKITNMSYFKEMVLPFQKKSDENKTMAKHRAFGAKLRVSADCLILLEFPGLLPCHSLTMLIIYYI